MFAFLLLAWMSTGCPTTRYYLALPPVRPGLGSEDIPCVIRGDHETWRRDALAQHKCGAWTDREMSDIMTHEWVFFPHFLIGSTGRTGRDCPQCWLDIQRPKGDAGEMQLTLHVPPNNVAMARYAGGVSRGLFNGEGTLSMEQTAACTRYCQDYFVVDGQSAQGIEIRGTWEQGFLRTEDGFEGAYVLVGKGRYDGMLLYDPLRGLIAHGRGRFEAADGGSYWGEWVDGRREGQGAAELANGSRYEGGWVADIWHGDGVLVLDDGSRFEGSFERGKRTGHGTLVNVDGSRYEGLWADDLPDGPGTRLGATGIRISGMWAAGVLANGAASIEWPDGSRYEGAVVDGLPHGRGTWTWPDESVYDGGWEHGRPSGRGVYRWPDGALWMGPWIDARPAGCGLYKAVDGEAWQGDWLAGRPVAAGCRVAPDTWSKEELPTFDGHGLVVDGIVQVWWAQRTTRASRLEAEERLDEVARRFARLPEPEEGDAPDDDDEADDDALRAVRFGFAWPIERRQRMVHPSCLDTVEVTVDGEPAEVVVGGVVDLDLRVALPGATTPQVCATMHGGCGSWTGCTAVDVPTDQSGNIVFARIPLQAPGPSVAPPEVPEGDAPEE